ncbi:hypothetical protein PV08_03732 [Exophiala spinifera]|uniref:ABM domain-containing protein n=1 Tax=Exophiala spinifera TaxID=91928 RepID=A0A0D2BZ27_9EURO|nr:uncharacterized protein PV08_03732 [Exophiala spinifera]KIW16544.1 hypothetical protein PV08_03732 [Exophiala spinifera]
MPRPVTEVVTLTLQPEANADEVISGWDDISYHKAFEQSETDFAAAGAFLGPVITDPPFMFHVYLDPVERERILSAPIIEVATFFSVPKGYSDEGEKLLRILGSFQGGLGFLHAEIVEDIAVEGINPKGIGWFNFLAWESTAQHVAAKESDAVQGSIHLIRGEGQMGEIERHYVKFTGA